MDLSAVVLPTHILEPRSFLEKTTDYFTHLEILSEAATKKDPMERLVCVVRWFLSGFYVMPKGVKKPYNPVLGETFRTFWILDPVKKSKVFFFSEQVSHHPPVSAFYLLNRADGWAVDGTIIFKSKFWGTSAGCELGGNVKITFFDTNQEFILTLPTAVSKGFIIPPLTLEYSGIVQFKLEKSDLSASVEFKLKPMFGGEFNKVAGKIMKGSQCMYTIQGRFDKLLTITDTATKKEGVFWNVHSFIEKYPKFTVPVFEQGPFESENLWKDVTKALLNSDQASATKFKTEIEENQRRETADREKLKIQWVPQLFEVDPKDPSGFRYKYPRNTFFNFETEEEDIELAGRVFTVPKTVGGLSPGKFIQPNIEVEKVEEILPVEKSTTGFVLSDILSEGVASGLKRTPTASPTASPAINPARAALSCSPAPSLLVGQRVGSVPAEQGEKEWQKEKEVESPLVETPPPK
eukprot:TRINITY_DN686_c1_g2_i2.p1 TRINITY_DN686_c1_g2~~TRINITY_DN686_c1_g2_i2.p1  ORF type:complete len:464 (-),score=137.41 TRINITY_DN686_c1_g2_i2:347-1738(-)